MDRKLIAMEKGARRRLMLWKKTFSITEMLKVHIGGAKIKTTKQRHTYESIKDNNQGTKKVLLAFWNQ